MTSKISATLFTALFFFGLITGLQAQDKYEFASVSFFYGPNNGKYTVEKTTPSGYEKKKVDFGNSEKGEGNHQPLFAELDKLQEEGWDVINIVKNENQGVAGHTVVAFLKRKKK